MTPENLRTKLLNTDQKCSVGCPILNQFLGGGIPTNSITEIVAESGSGKTQLCLQLLLSAQLPISNGGSSLYLHTELPFPSRRLHQLSQFFRSSNPHILPPDYDPCLNIFVHPVNSADHLLDILLRLDSFISNNNSNRPVRLIVIDSIAAVFRSEFDNTLADLKRRSFLLFKIAGKLKWLANRYGLAVVVTNQVVDAMVGSSQEVRVGNTLYSSGRQVCPALGLGWSNCVNTRLFLSMNEESDGLVCGGGDGGGDVEFGSRRTRRIHVVFAPHLPCSSCEFIIKREGVSGVI